GLDVEAGGDAEVYAFLPNTHPFFNNPSATPSSPVTVLTGDGTVYSFPNFGHTTSTNNVSAGLPSKIEDRNGNEITIADNNNGNFVVTDTAERKLISSDGFGGPINTLTIPGGRYTIDWD